MNRVLATMLAAVLASSFNPLAASATTPVACDVFDGSGTETDPFLIANAVDLASIADCDFEAGGGLYFRQSEDIVLEGDWTPIFLFRSQYDGGYNSISGLNVNSPDSWGGGLFQFVQDATIKQLTVVSDNIFAESYVGVLGADGKNVTVDNVRVLSTGLLDSIYGAGCLFGTAKGSLSFNEIYANCNTDSGVGWVGGLAGNAGPATQEITELSISKTYVDGDFRFSISGGGIFGRLGIAADESLISGFSFTGSLTAPAREDAYVGGLFGSVSRADGTPDIRVEDSAVLGFIGSELFTQIPVIEIPPVFDATMFFSQSPVSPLETPFFLSPTVGKVFSTGGVSPSFSFEKMILNPKYETPAGSDGYLVNIGVDPALYSANPSCVFHTEPPVDYFRYELDSSMTSSTPSELSDLATFSGCLDIADGLSSMQEQSLWVKDDSIFNGKVWPAQLVHFELHRSPLDYSVSSVAINHDEIFSQLNLAWNFFPEFSIDPALPEGITLDSNTGRIRGAAAQGFGPQTFTVTRNSLFGFDSTSVEITLSQLDAPSAGAGNYLGPIIERVTPDPVQRGQLLTIEGQRLDQVGEVRIGGVLVLEDSLSASKSVLEFEIPLNTPLGQQELVLSGNFGSLTYQNGVFVLDEGLRFEVREMSNGDLKLYAFGIVGQGKIQFKVNGNEIAWVRAISPTDKRLRTLQIAQQVVPYFVRTISPGADALIEFYVDGELFQARN